MAHIEAFHAVRYDLGHVGSLSDVVAPPYDVISPEMQRDLYRRHPANVIRLILNREEAGDDAANNRYTRAARYLKNWQHEGVLQRDPDPAVYVYHQTFRHAGREFTRRGFMARVRLERFGEGRIYPHEETHSAAKTDRLNLTLACRANLSQVFGLYPDAENTCQSLAERTIQGGIPVEATDHLGVVHRMWAVTDVKTISELAAAMDDRPVFIADGHHRYETACNYRDRLAAEGSLPSNHPATLRADDVRQHERSRHDRACPRTGFFGDCRPTRPSSWPRNSAPCFALQPAGEGPAEATRVWNALEPENNQHALGFYTHADRQWTVARLTDAGPPTNGRSRCGSQPGLARPGGQRSSPPGHRDTARSKADPNPKYVHLVEELVADLGAGRCGRRPFSPGRPGHAGDRRAHSRH